MPKGTTSTTEAHAGIAHPTVRTRLLEELGSMTNLLDQTPADLFAEDDAWLLLQRHAESIETLMRHAELHRPSLHPI